MKVVYSINWWESERGWGQKFITKTYYKSREEAVKDVEGTTKAFSTESGFAPDYYQYPGSAGILISEMTDEEYAKCFLE